jgi:hypothetical protein
MRWILRRGVTLLAVYAVALHVVLLGLAPISANATVDPFSVICHSVTDTQGDEAPKSGLIPGHACEHCTLCNMVAPPPAPDMALDVTLAPAPVLAVLRPASTPVRAGVTSDPKLARGPPQLT